MECKGVDPAKKGADMHCEAIFTKCKCGEPICVELNNLNTLRADGKRPFYPDAALPEGADPERYSLTRVSVLRCRKCLKPVSETVPEAAFGPALVAYLDEICQEKIARILAFRGHYMEQNKINPSDYPLSLPVDNAGVWDEMIASFQLERPTDE